MRHILFLFACLSLILLAPDSQALPGHVRFEDRINALSAADIEMVTETANEATNLDLTIIVDDMNASEIKTVAEKAVTSDQKIAFVIDPIHGRLQTQFGTDSGIKTKEVRHAISQSGIDFFNQRRWALGIMTMIETASLRSTRTKVISVPEMVISLNEGAELDGATQATTSTGVTPPAATTQPTMATTEMIIVMSLLVGLFFACFFIFRKDFNSVPSGTLPSSQIQQRPSTVVQLPTQPQIPYQGLDPVPLKEDGRQDGVSTKGTDGLPGGDT